MKIVLLLAALVLSFCFASIAAFNASQVLATPAVAETPASPATANIPPPQV